MEPVEVEIEVVEVDTTSVDCDGGDGVLGHPRVWVAIDGSGRGKCGYCGREFVLRADRASGSEATDRGPGSVDAGDPQD